MKKIQKLIGNIPIYTKSIIPEMTKNSRDIVFIHMSWGSSWVFNSYMKFFARYGYSCHALDLRGHGSSGGTVDGATMQDYVDDVRTIVVDLKLNNPIVIGHSMGGLVALMYSAQHGSSATVSIDGSPSIEVQKTSEEKTYPKSYTPKDSGMPSPLNAMAILNDIYPWRLMKMKMILKTESGVARSERKKGVSVPKESLTQPLLFVGAGNGTSLPFGIGIEKVKAQAEYYGSPVVEIKGASHPGILIGKHWKQSANSILEWLHKNT